MRYKGSVGDGADQLRREVETLRARIKELESARASVEQFRTLAVHSPVGMFLDDTDGRAIYINRRCAELVGMPAEDALSFDWIAAMHPDDRERVVAAWTDAFEKQHEFHEEYRWLHRDGHVVWTQGDIVPVRDDEGRVVVFIGTLTDVSERKAIEAEQHILLEKLAQSQKMETVGRLAGGVAHDFNNMLTVIISCVELSRRTRDAKKLDELLSEIEEAAHRSADFTGHLLGYARKQPIAPKVLDVNERVAETLGILRRAIGRATQVAWEPAEDLWPIHMDDSQLSQILMNLVVNARDAGASHIVISTSKRAASEGLDGLGAVHAGGDVVVLSVTDDGAGVDSEDMGHVFEPYFTTKATGEGTGLGLATVYGIARQNGGWADIHSSGGKGCTIAVAIPAHHGVPVTAELTKQVPRGDERILVVDDELAVLRALSMIASELGYRTVTASSASEALALLSDSDVEIDLLMTDVVMPDMNGVELTQKCRALRPGLRCLYMSGYDAAILKNLGEPYHFLKKPFKTSDLAATIREALEQQQVSRGAVG